MPSYQDEIQQMSEVCGAHTVESLRNAPAYRVFLRLRTVMIESDIPAPVATRAAARARIDVAPEVLEEEGFWELVDKMASLGILLWKALIEDIGAEDAATTFDEWANKMHITLTPRSRFAGNSGCTSD